MNVIFICGTEYQHKGIGGPKRVYEFSDGPCVEHPPAVGDDVFLPGTESGTVFHRAMDYADNTIRFLVRTDK